MPINPPNMKIVFDPPMSYISVEMICRLSSYRAPPIRTKKRIYSGPALPTIAENAIVMESAILNAPVAVLPKVL